MGIVADLHRCGGPIPLTERLSEVAALIRATLIAYLDVNAQPASPRRCDLARRCPQHQNRRGHHGRARRVLARTTFLTDITECGWSEVPPRKLMFSDDIPTLATKLYLTRGVNRLDSGRGHP